MQCLLLAQFLLGNNQKQPGSVVKTKSVESHFSHTNLQTLVLITREIYVYRSISQTWQRREIVRLYSHC